MSYEKKLSGLHDELAELKNKAAALYNEHAPQFDRGVAEASMERTTALLKDIKDVFNKHGIAAAYSAKMMSTQQTAPDGLPIVEFGGIMVNIDTRIFPLDGKGNQSVPEEVHKELVKYESQIRAKEAKIQKLVQKMHGVREG